ncbi:carbohydrate kinase [Wolfiporia cocos MD-104 SS10]|uniref:gluconokinase n=1 Tax=Wolfiporia cocos (strain MD-104) TaxID=742152 RepID=A0A2H3JEF9_WOLCO|nr:carbohydrate kinase [Wolfiporia cocos MD-104 SS10]
MAEENLKAHKSVLIIVMGVAGTGKTTLAKSLSETLDLPYIEGDELHPPANIEKMSAGQPLTDADREPWLALLRTTAEHLVVEQQKESRPDPQLEPEHVHEPSGESASKPALRRRAGALVTCSALRKYYRDILRGELRPNLPEPVHDMEPPVPPAALPTYFVYIKGERELLLERVAKRQGHYMKANMVDSQLEILENPEGEDGVIVVGMDESTEQQQEKVIQALKDLTERV